MFASRRDLRILLGAAALAAGMALWLGASGNAQEAPAVAKSARGGLLAQTEQLRFEVFFYPTGVRVFARDGSGSPVDTSKLGGTATFYHPNSANPWFSRPLRGTNESLDLAIRLESVPPSGARAAFAVTGLSGNPVSFAVPLEFVLAKPALPSAPSVSAVEVTPRYVYGPGYYGYGYYSYPGPDMAPQAATASGVTRHSSPSLYSGSGSMAGHTVGPMHRDWTTGRSSGLHKPWLRPMD